MKRKILGAFFVWLVCLPARGQSANDFEVEVHDEGRQAIIMGYTGTAKDVTIPERVNGVPVTSINDHVFGDKMLTSVTLPASLGQGYAPLGTNAFYDNKLAEIVIPDGITRIGTQAFARNQLRRIKIGSGVKLGQEEYGWYAFATVGWNEESGRFYHVDAHPFDAFYIKNGRKAGVYTLGAGGWSYSAR